jgi:hypothetical protein
MDAAFNPVKADRIPAANCPFQLSFDMGKLNRMNRPAKTFSAVVRTLRALENRKG